MGVRDIQSTELFLIGELNLLGTAGNGLRLEWVVPAH